MKFTLAPRSSGIAYQMYHHLRASRVLKNFAESSNAMHNSNKWWQNCVLHFLPLSAQIFFLVYNLNNVDRFVCVEHWYYTCVKRAVFQGYDRMIPLDSFFEPAAKNVRLSCTSFRPNWRSSGQVGEIVSCCFLSFLLQRCS